MEIIIKADLYRYGGLTNLKKGKKSMVLSLCTTLEKHLYIKEILF